MRNNKKGFTIVELVIVIAVIAILAAVLIPTFSSITQSAKESAAMQQAKSGLNGVLALTGGSMPSGTIFAVNDDDDTSADYLYEYKNNKLQLKASGDEAVAEYKHTQKFDGNFCVYVSAKTIAENKLQENTAKLIYAALGASTTVPSGGVALNSESGKSYYFFNTTIGEGEAQTQATVHVYYTSDIEDTMVILLGDDGAETPNNPAAPDGENQDENQDVNQDENAGQ